MFLKERSIDFNKNLKREGSLFFLMFIFERKRQSASGRGTERERETQNPKQAPGFELSAQNLTQGSNSQTVRA